MRQVELTLEQRDRTIITLSLLVIFFVVFFVYLKNRTPDIVNHPTDRDSIVVYGDSLAAGVGSSDGEGFVADLENLVNREIEQIGVPGETTEGGLRRLEQLIDMEPGIVIISLGGNDYIRRVPEEDMRQNYNIIISRLQNNGSIVMILGAPGYHYAYSGLARDHKAAYIPNILHRLITNPDYMSDTIHPNDMGYQKIAEKIAPELRKLVQ